MPFDRDRLVRFSDSSNDMKKIWTCWLRSVLFAVLCVLAALLLFRVRNERFPMLDNVYSAANRTAEREIEEAIK